MGFALSRKAADLHSNIVALLLGPSLCQLLNAAMNKSHIGCLETKFLHVVLKIGFSYFHLEKENYRFGHQHHSKINLFFPENCPIANAICFPCPELFWMDRQDS